jgi:hypothetical protein
LTGSGDRGRRGEGDDGGGGGGGALLGWICFFFAVVLCNYYYYYYYYDIHFIYISSGTVQHGVSSLPFL